MNNLLKLNSSEHMHLDSSSRPVALSWLESCWKLSDKTVNEFKAILTVENDV